MRARPSARPSRSSEDRPDRGSGLHLDIRPPSDAIGDRWIEFSIRVKRHQLSFEVAADPEYPRGHGDWLLAEVLLTEDSEVVHEIELERGTWQIECADLTYSFGFNVSSGIED